jgi:two-component system, sensor histidine kinase and response regulator
MGQGSTCNGGDSMAKLWLVEDDKNLANLTKIALGKKGHEVEIFSEGLKAVEVAQKRKPDLILMDVMMPDISGGEVLKLLRKDPDLRDIPVIFLTALISSSERNVGISIDGINFQTLGKPYDMKQLLESVENSLG